MDITRVLHKVLGLLEALILIDIIHNYFIYFLVMSELSQTANGPSEGENYFTSPIFVGNKQDFVEKQKVKCNVNGRDIVVFYHNQQFYAMDQHCYRK